MFSPEQKALFSLGYVLSPDLGQLRRLCSLRLPLSHLEQPSLPSIPGEIKLPKGYCDADLTLDSQLEVLLPRRRGLGLCSTALASYLISLHNDFIHSVNKHSKEDDQYVAIPARRFGGALYYLLPHNQLSLLHKGCSLQLETVFLLQVLDQSIRSGRPALDQL